MGLRSEVLRATSPRPPDTRSRTPRRERAASTDGDRIRVAVRKRPLGVGGQDVVDAEGKDIVVHEPKLKVDLTKFIDQQRFTFDHTFGEQATSRDVYSACVSPLVKAAVQGARCTCLAYGQTGSGKTYTMVGTRREQGMLGFSCDELFRLVQPGELEATVSAYEIYCGKLYDLLNGRNVLQARENARQQVVIVGLHEQRVDSREHFFQVVENGLASRKTGTTAGNADSSRSHMVVQIRLLRNGAEHGKISFVDLAGSERGADVGDSCRETRKDGAEINKSLLALKECIRAMDQQKEHQPFRGSKLTQVLKDSFVGDSCRTLIIATVCPSARNVEHTLNTLRYAWRVRELPAERRAQAPEEPQELARPRSQPYLARVEEDARGKLSRAEAKKELRPEPRKELARVEARKELPRVTRQSKELSRQSRDGLEGKQSKGVPSRRDTSKDPPRPDKERFRSATEDRREMQPDAPREVWDDARASEAAALARRHAELTEKIVEDEEEIIAFHRSHIDEMVNGLKSQMEALNRVDQPGSDVEEYNHYLLSGLAAEEEQILAVRKKLHAFRLDLQEERLLSERACAVGLV